MRIFNLPNKLGYQVPLAIGALAGGAGAAVAGTAIGTGMMAGAVASGVGALASGALGGKGGNKIQAPASRNYLGEMQNAIAAQEAIQPNLLKLEGQYTPQYQELQKQTLMGQMDTLGGLYDYATPLSQRLQAQYAGSQLPIYGAIGQLSNQAYQQGLGTQTMGLYDTMQRQAQEGLDAGYGLTPEMQRQAQQSARAAMSARGLAGGNQGIAQEVLNSYALGQERYQRSLANANQAYGLGVNQFGNAMGTYGTPLLNQMQAYTPQAMYGQSVAGSQMLGTKIFQPESQYNAGLIGANQSNQMQTQLGNAQIASAKESAQMGLAGQVLGAGLMYAGQMGGFSKMFGGTSTLQNPQATNYSSGNNWFTPATTSVGNLGAGVGYYSPLYSNVV